jgi:hypothetical protein
MSGMIKGGTVTVQSNYSITGESCEVEVVDIDRRDLSVYVRYPNGYTEWLPISAFQGF